MVDATNNVFEQLLQHTTESDEKAKDKPPFTMTYGEACVFADMLKDEIAQASKDLITWAKRIDKLSQ